MKTELSITKSLILIGLGVPEEKASKIITENIKDYDDGISSVGTTYRVFKLEDLFKILPKYLKYEFEGVKYAADFSFRWNNRFLHYEAGYDLYDMWDKSHHCAAELIDALYELIVWYLKNKKELEK